MFALEHVLDGDSFFFLLDLEIKRARRYQNYLSLLSLTFNNLDRSPTENAGISLTTMANLIVDDLRETDVVGIGNGNHFLVMIPYADTVAASIVKERLQQIPYNYGLNKKGVTLQIEEACFPTQATNIHDLLRVAKTKSSKQLH